MSSGLMSCVRENSPPLDMHVNASGPLSLPESSTNASMNTSGAPANAATQQDGNVETAEGAAGCADHTKRRRFRPLHNLRRIFRRRTITSVADTPAKKSLPPPSSSKSEKNLRSATLSSISTVGSASSPSSPLTHQQLQDAYSSQSLPKSKSYGTGGTGRTLRDVLLGGGDKHKAHQQQLHQQQQQQQQQVERKIQRPVDSDMYTATTTTTSTTSYRSAFQQQQQQTLVPSQSLGVAVLPSAMSRSFYTERKKLRNAGDSSSQDLDSSGNDSGSNAGVCNVSGGGSARANGSGSGGSGEMTDSQRSLSEGRLIDSDYSHDPLSHSHDSVFSESATASSLSIVLKAELADVLRKRRNRPDASDEDLGLPRSPASPQRRAEQHRSHHTSGHNSSSLVTTHHTTTASGGAGNQSEVSSLSLLSINSNEGDEFLATSTANNTTLFSDTERSNSSSVSGQRFMLSSTVSSDILRQCANSSLSDATAKDEVDLFSSDWQRLSHAAAKHKMAVRPTKKKVPSRQHRRTLETSIPEANEDSMRSIVSNLLDTVDYDARSKTRSLPPGVNAKTLEQHVDDKQHTATLSTSTPGDDDLTINKLTKIETTSTSTSTSTTVSSTSTSTTNLFGFRAFSAKATSIFEPKEASSKELPTEAKKPEPASTLETTESGFLRRLMQRNSKRSIAKANNGEEELDNNQSEPKKVQISTSFFEPVTSPLINVSTLEKSRSALTHEQNVAETRREIKREIMSVGNSGLSAMLNNFMTAEKSHSSIRERDPTQHKPKSGAAARQRYVPQEIAAESTPEPKTTPTTSRESLHSVSLLSKQETFQSTSIVRKITDSQQAAAMAAKPEHHFEKKPKIVGLSAFQQKISRSNDSFTRNSSSNSNSTNSLEAIGEANFLSVESKQRKSVEKSRSFRTYTEERETAVQSMHNNMPSLPDLTLNLRVPVYGEFILSDKEYSSPSPPEPHDKSNSLGFEINDNNLVKTSGRAESTGHLHHASQSNYAKNIILTTSTVSGKVSTPGKLLTPGSVMPSLSPTNSCNKNISEIEQNIDMIVKSPFISVLRKSIVMSDEEANDVVVAAPPLQVKQEANEKVRPKVLYFKEKSIEQEPDKQTPTTPSAVQLRDKQKLTCGGAVRTSIEVALAPIAPAKELERKSAPALQTSKASSFKATRRSSSVIDSTDTADSNVPEFMKIQLNRVDPARIAKSSNVVLAKNVKEPATPSPHTPIKESERSVSHDDLCLRRLSNESVEITEKEEADVPALERRISGVFEAINKQAKSVSTTSIRSHCDAALPPKSPMKKAIVSPLLTPTDSNEEVVVVLRPKSKECTELATNKLSLQERKRLFMNENMPKVDKKVEELRNERKKSINEEMFRKPFAKSEEKLESPTEVPESIVVLRKKSFSATTQQHIGSTVSSSSNNNHKDDPTPELMKVFARRSLKIKDEDLNALADKIMQHNNGVNGGESTTVLNGKKFARTQNVDSDKENQSSSEEKLDKLPKLEVLGSEQQSAHKIVSATATYLAGGGTTNGMMATSNRNSLADFRNTSYAHAKHANYANGVGLTLNNNNNNNNNNNAATATSTTPVSAVSSKSFLPPIKVCGFRTTSMERNGSVSKLGTPVANECLNNNNNNLLNNNGKSTLERQSLNIKALEAEPASTHNKTIERSATVGEFKGIHQRRAEWEQRAKEALK